MSPPKKSHELWIVDPEQIAQAIEDGTITSAWAHEKGVLGFIVEYGENGPPKLQVNINIYENPWVVAIFPEEGQP